MKNEFLLTEQKNRSVIHFRNVAVSGNFATPSQWLPQAVKAVCDEYIQSIYHDRWGVPLAYSEAPHTSWAFGELRLTLQLFAMRYYSEEDGFAHMDRVSVLDTEDLDQIIAGDFRDVVTEVTLWIHRPGSDELRCQLQRAAKRAVDAFWGMPFSQNALTVSCCHGSNPTISGNIKYFPLLMEELLKIS